ncbi:cytochrome c oxidase assembly protein [Virgibacillus oceani]|uniref:Cytochrome c oxidase assembly factor CtaG n=1 Tax=Virgibacillus oceani TaxID=1479511 RepID=A0A917M8Y8_9BACI|nr:cytochrome c oxidase assembly protein [Virgibacillus oceani]GGG85223.1 cytochrome c oxidase assembly factor CtaG [Virgibacillus oceani]
MHVKNQFKIIGLALLLYSFSPLKAFAHNPNAARATGDGKVLEHYTWVEILNPLLILGLVAVFVIYLWAMRKVSIKHEVRHKLGKKIAFLLGLLTTYLSLAGPVSIYANNLVFSAHMLQQAMMYIAMPMLILLGMPRVFYEFLDKRLLKIKIMRIFKSPLISALLFNLLWSLYHIPVIYEYIWQQLFLLETSHLVINSAAFMMWIHVLAPQGLVNNMSYLMKIGYMFLDGVLITPACALIIFANDVLYSSIYQAPLMFSFSTPQDDQQLGGILMKIIQEIFYGAAIAYTFFKWAREERAKDVQVDEIPIGAVE